MKISINQPAYIPWQGYFDRIDYADIHVVLDHVQFEKNSFTNRNKILSNQGPQWITIPVTKGLLGQVSIHSMRTLNNKKWIKNHLKTLIQNYSKSPFFDEYFTGIERELVSKVSEDNFFQIIESINVLIMNYLGITTPVVYSSDLKIESKKSDLVLDICKSQYASEYLSGSHGKDYLELDKFKQEKINIRFQNYNHPSYKQKQEEFFPYLSVLDLLFNHGTESLNILREGRNFNI